MASGVISQLRALAWMRWRVFSNGPKGGSRRDAVERFSRALEYLFPMAAIAIFVPLALASAAVGGGAGWLMAQGRIPPAAFVSMRWLGLVLVAVIFSTVIFRASFEEPANAPRLRLLPFLPAVAPIDELVRSVGNPWLALAVPAILVLPLGFAASGRFADAVVLLPVGAALVVLLASGLSLVRILLEEICRRPGRRRLVSIGFMFLTLAIPMALLLGDLAEPGGDARPAVIRQMEEVGVTGLLVPFWLRLLPTEPWVRGVEAVANGRPGEAVLAMVLGGGFAVLLAAAALFFGRRHAGETSRGRGRRRTGVVSWKRFAGLSVGTESVARGTFLSLVRSGPGRMQLVVVPATFLCLSLLLARAGQRLPTGQGPVLDAAAAAAAGVGMALFGAAGIAVNGFAVARGGLTRTFLLPLTSRELVRGTVLGFALIAAPVVALNLVSAALFFPASAPLRWAAGLMGGAGTALGWLSFALVPAAILPRAADLSNDWKGSQPHEGAALASMVAGALLVAIPWQLDRLSTRAGLGEPGGLAVQAGFFVASAAVAALLLRQAERLVEARRESLALSAEGR